MGCAGLFSDPQQLQQHIDSHSCLRSSLLATSDCITSDDHASGVDCDDEPDDSVAFLDGLQQLMAADDDAAAATADDSDVRG